MDEGAITEHITEAYPGVDTVVAMGATFFFYNPGDGTPKDHTFPFATLVTTDEHDQFSDLARPGVFRLNVGVSKGTFRSLFADLTTEGLSEDVRIGDRFRIGTAEFVVTQPRMPCFKLGIRLGRTDVLRRMLRTGRTGFYFSVAVEGEVGAGDTIELVRRSEEDLTVADVVRLFTVEAKNQDLLRRAIQSPVLPPNWKDHFRQRLG